MSSESIDRPWKADIVKEYLTSTAQQKDDVEKFYDTHLDIDRIYAEFLGPFQDTQVTQEQFRDELLDAPIDHDIRTFILRGETGSGKSQLCQWLDYELQGHGSADVGEDRIPLHIKASQTNLEHIIETLAEPLDEDPAIRQVTELDAAAVADAIVTNLTANPGQVLADANVERLVDEGELESHLTANIKTYQDGLDATEETEFDPNLLSKDDYRDITLRLGTESAFHEDKDILRTALRDEIHRHFSHVIGVDDFQSQLRDYSQRYIEELGKRPVIICEDVTTFSVLKEQLLDQIIQPESAAYDIVLGYTTGFEQDDLQDALSGRGTQDALTYLKDRAEGYLSLTENGSALFLDNDLSVTLVRKYLDVIKRESDGDIETGLEAGFDDLYPLNRAAIQLAFGRLIENGSPRRTPRVLLQKVVRRILLSETPPYSVLDESPNVDGLVTPVDPSRYDNELQKLATWYGYADEIRDDSSAILVNRTVLDTFGFDDVKESTIDHEGTTYVALRSNEAAARLLGDSSEARPTVPRSDPSDVIEADDPDDSDDVSTSEVENEPPQPSGGTTGTADAGTSDRDPEATRRQDQISEFYEWIETGDSYPSSDLLRDGAETVLNYWHEPAKLGNYNTSRQYPAGIYYTRGQEIPVSIQGPDEREGISVELPFGKEHLAVYTDLLEVGLHDEDGLPADVATGRLHSWAVDAVARFRATMRDRLEGCLPEGLTIEHSIVLAKFLLVNAEFGTTEFGRETVFDRRIPRDDRKYESPVMTAYSETSGLWESLSALQVRRSDIEDLLDGFFLLKENVVDHDRLSPIVQDIAAEPEEYLKLAQQINTDELDFPSAYNVGTSRKNAGTSFATILEEVAEYAIELSRMEDEDLADHFEPELGPINRWYQDTHTVPDLATELDTLIDCLGTFDVTRAKQWKETQELLKNAESTAHLERFGEHVSEFRSPATSSVFDRMGLLHDFERSQVNHEVWDIYGTFDEIIENLSKFDVEEGEDLSGRVAELDVLEEYETVRTDVLGSIEEANQ